MIPHKGYDCGRDEQGPTHTVLTQYMRTRAHLSSRMTFHAFVRPQLQPCDNLVRCGITEIKRVRASTGWYLSVGSTGRSLSVYSHDYTCKGSGVHTGKILSQIPEMEFVEADSITIGEPEKAPQLKAPPPYRPIQQQKRPV